MEQNTKKLIFFVIFFVVFILFIPTYVVFSIFTDGNVGLRGVLVVYYGFLLVVIINNYKAIKHEYNENMRLERKFNQMDDLDDLNNT